MKKLYNKYWYTPREIARKGLIQNRKGDEASESGNYNFVLQLIKTGQLQAKNYSTGTKIPYYLVSEDEIARYHLQFTK